MKSVGSKRRYSAVSFHMRAIILQHQARDRAEKRRGSARPSVEKADHGGCSTRLGFTFPFLDTVIFSVVAMESWRTTCPSGSFG